MKQISGDDVNNIIKDHVQKFRDDIRKLDEVEKLLPKEIVDEKKTELVNIVFALQNVQSEVLNLIQHAIDQENNRRMMESLSS